MHSQTIPPAPSSWVVGWGQHNIDHDVILDGWDDTLVTGKTVWDLRNSWSPSRCENGYIRIMEGANLVGTEAVFAVAPTPVPPPGPTPGSPAPAPTRPECDHCNVCWNDQWDVYAESDEILSHERPGWPPLKGLFVGFATQS